MLSKKVISAVLVAGMLAATASAPALADGPRGGYYHHGGGNYGAGIFAGVLGALVVGSIIADANTPVATTTYYYVPQTTYYPPQQTYPQSTSSSGPVEGRDFIYSSAPSNDSASTQVESTPVQVYSAPVQVYSAPQTVYYAPAPVYYSPAPYYDPFFWPTVDLVIGGSYWYGGHGGWGGGRGWGGGHGGWHR